MNRIRQECDPPFRNELMRELINAFGYLGIHQVASVLFGLVRSKLVAAFLGTFGMGIFSQANNFMELVRQVALFGIGDGYFKLLAEFRNHNDTARLSKTILTGLLFFGLLGTVVSVLISVFSTTVSVWIFADPQYGWFVFLIAVTGFFYAEYNVFFFIYQALLKWKEYALVSVIGYIFNILISLVMILWLHLWGAILSMLIAQGVTLFLVVYVLRKRVLPFPIQTLWQHLPDRSSVAKLLRFIGPLSTIALASALAPIIIRSGVVHSLGVEENGIYQVVYAISLSYMGLLRNVFTGFGLPKVTVVLDQPEKIVQIQNDELRLGLLLLCPGLILVMLTRKIWIPLLYSPAFLGAASLVFWQSIADLLRMIRFSMNVTLLPMGRFRFILLDGLVDWVGWAVLSLLLIPSMGIIAVPFSYFVTSLLTLGIDFVYHKNTTIYRINPQNSRLLIKGFSLVIPGLCMMQWGQGVIWQVAVPTAILLLMILWLPEKSEHRQMMNFIQERILKRK